MSLQRCGGIQDTTIIGFDQIARFCTVGGWAAMLLRLNKTFVEVTGRVHALREIYSVAEPWRGCAPDWHHLALKNSYDISLWCASANLGVTLWICRHIIGRLWDLRARFSPGSTFDFLLPVCQDTYLVFEQLLVVTPIRGILWHDLEPESFLPKLIDSQDAHITVVQDLRLQF